MKRTSWESGLFLFAAYLTPKFDNAATPLISNQRASTDYADYTDSCLTQFDLNLCNLRNLWIKVLGAHPCLLSVEEVCAPLVCSC